MADPITISALPLFADAQGDIRIDVAETGKESITLTRAKSGVSICALLVNGVDVGYFQSLLSCASFGMAMENSRALALLRDATYQLVDLFKRGDVDAFGKHLVALVKYIDEADRVLAKGLKISKGESWLDGEKH